MKDDGARRLLVVSYHFPPENTVGGLRWWGLSRYLLERGWGVRVISAQPVPTELPEGDFQVRQVKPVRTLDERYRAWRVRGGGNGNGDAAGYGASRQNRDRADEGSAPVRAFQRVRRELSALSAFPDIGRGWIRPAAAAVRETVATFDPHAVVSSGPPHSVHIATRRGVRGSRARWFMDFRDPWRDAQGLTPLTTWLHGRLERRSMRAAGLALTTTPEFRDVLRKRYPEAGVRWLSNGVDPADLPERPALASDAFVLTHVGTVYWRRDPGPLLEGVQRFLARVPEARDALRVSFVGSVNREYVPVIEAARRNGLDRHVELLGTVPRDEALDHLARASVAVVLAQEQGLMVPAKIYESLGIGVPTLAITETGSATAAAATRLGAQVGDPRDPGGIAEAIERIWNDRECHSGPVADVRYDRLAERADALLRGGNVEG